MRGVYDQKQNKQNKQNKQTQQTKQTNQSKQTKQTNNDLHLTLPMLAKTTRRRFIFVTRAKHLVWDKEWGKWHETKSGRTGMGPKVKELTSNQERKNWHGQKNVVQT